MITPTTSIGLMHTIEKESIRKQTVTHKIDLIKMEHRIIKRKLKT